ncbi:Rne/Rng family ribonuclease [Paenibacillus ginsengarvi]|uniref:Rne/Rng family ribonuclease n=1 Tax=Paenibacillus ginsengarvi TaxID=400777 RepID=A0A3B0CGH9_9BACL|nr:Rne/Rng family ribonuclease [Paenibacillus ginsengarvi]RKN83844.1 Rne/Rng family ribonuclease [Paenibacillus ginsengarvi]
MKQIVVHCRDTLTQVALLEERVLTEFYAERPVDKQLVGSVYIGKVVNVLPGMQAAFVDIGLDKNAFLYIDDLLPAHLDKIPLVKPSISELIQPGQKLLVQVIKEPLGTKGARITTHFSLPGRWIVYMPNADYVGVSRKISSEQERSRLKDVAEQLRRPGEGLIIRTVAEHETLVALERDLGVMRGDWEDVLRLAETSEAPLLLYREPGVLDRVVRDAFNDYVDELIIDDPVRGEALGRRVREMSEELAQRIHIYKKREPVFVAYPVKEQLERAMKRKVWLKSGGYLVLDRTEALTVIDVNTGKFTGTDDPEATVFTTNAEAAAEIARLLRLRDIGGIVLVDFIDMTSDKHRADIAALLEQEFRKDRTKTFAVGWTKLGLMEITRKKARESLDDSMFAVCGVCGGTGKVPIERASQGKRR